MKALSTGAALDQPVDELVICTRDRPADLARCLASVKMQTLRQFSVSVVDGGTLAPCTSAVAAFRATCRPTIEVRYFATTPGLARQRNFALSRLQPTTKYVHFVDDDTVLGPDYLQRIRQVFEDDLQTTIGGVGGAVQNQPAGSSRNLETLLGLDDPVGGVVLKSGVNVLLHGADVRTDVQWLSGCAMSYRTVAFEGRCFDGTMEGYSLGEDVDFSFALHRSMRLVVEPRAAIWHMQSPTNRQHSRRLARDRVLFRYSLHREHPDRVSLAAMLGSAVASVALDVIAGTVYRRPGRSQAALGTLAGIWQLVGSSSARHPRLGKELSRRDECATER